jgi:chromosome segregation ATPase
VSGGICNPLGEYSPTVTVEGFDVELAGQVSREMAESLYHRKHVISPRGLELKLEKIMSDISALTTAVSDLQQQQAALAAAAGDVVTTVQDLVAEVQALQNATTGGDTAAIEQAVSTITEITSEISSFAAELTSAAQSDPGPPATTTTPPSTTPPASETVAL